MVNRKELDPTSGPWAPFGVQLRRSREAKKLTQAELARKVGYDASYVSYAELASREAPSEKFARRADEVLETGGTLTLMWLQNRHSALLEGFPEYAAKEAKANEIRIFELGVIPGLLQTEAYARAIAAADVRRREITPDQAEERVAFLLLRQKLMERKAPPLIHAVLDESCLWRAIGGTEVMQEQFDRLEEQSDQGNVVLQVAPFSMGEHRPFAVSIRLLTMPDGAPVGYSESEGRGHIERDDDRLRDWRRRYDRLQVGALAEMASLELIRTTRRESHG